MNTPHGAHIRIGVLYPGGGAEFEYFLFADRVGGISVYLVTTEAIGEEDHKIDALLQTGDIGRLQEGASKLARLRPTVATWACTSGSFVAGVKYAKKQVEAISAITRCPTSSTSLAFLAATRALHVERAAVVATYPDATASRFVQFLEEGGVTVSKLKTFDVWRGWESSRLDLATIAEAAESVVGDGAQAVLVPDTALPTLDTIASLEARVSVPVLTANQVTLWHSWHLSGCARPVTGYGRLLMC